MEAIQGARPKARLVSHQLLNIPKAIPSSPSNIGIELPSIYNSSIRAHLIVRFALPGPRLRDPHLNQDSRSIQIPNYLWPSS